MSRMRRAAVPIERVYGPFPEHSRVHGVTFDGERVWFASDEGVVSLDPQTGKLGRALPVAADAGTAFDGKYLYQLTRGQINKIDPHTAQIVSSVAAPTGVGSSGLTWAEGSLWVGCYREREILELDPTSGKVLRTVRSDRFVTGVSFADGELWHATDEAGSSELRRVDPDTSEVLECLELPADVRVSGLEADAQGGFFCGGAETGTVRVVKKPRQAAR